MKLPEQRYLSKKGFFSKKYPLITAGVESTPKISNHCKTKLCTPPRAQNNNTLLSLFMALPFDGSTSCGPFIIGLIICFMFLPHFSLGLAAGAVTCAILAAMSYGLNAIFPILDPYSPYAEFIITNPVYVMLIGPFIEEGIFHGLLQPFLIFLALCIVPSASVPLFLGINAAALAAICLTALAFGAIHVFNDHNHSHRQAVFGVLAGLVNGYLTLQFGLGAAIGSHIINNVIAFFSLVWSVSHSPNVIAPRQESPTMYCSPA